MAEATLLQVEESRQNLMENFSSLLLCHWSSAVNFVKKLPILAVLHENVDFVVPTDDLIDLGYVLMHKIFLQLYLPLDCLELIRLVLIDSSYFDCYYFSCEFVYGFLDLAEPTLADGFLYVMEAVLSS